jgi:beta-galactosidase/beta-glucuronidase
VPQQGIAECHITPDVDSGRVVLAPTFFSVRAGYTFRARLLDDGKVVASMQGIEADGIALTLELKSPKLWSPSSPFLYTIVLEVVDAGGAVVDSVKSYVGMRKIHVEGNRVFLNNEPIYLRFVLDQGFYPDGIWTAPSDEALKRDIELSKRAGFNGARLHQKVFEPRFHYWADRLGYLTWGEFASWGIDIWGRDGNANNHDAAWGFLSEWREVVLRDRSHPSIIAWTPLNETSTGAGGHVHKRFHADVYDLTKALDLTRPVNDSSGYAHVKTDLWTVHNYEQDPATLRAVLTPAQSGVWRNEPEHEADYSGQPYIVDEFGGMQWIREGEGPWAADSWGYGDGPKSLDEFYARLEGLVGVLLGMEHIVGYCYTQLTDVEQEQNGIYTYDRNDKFDMARVRAIFGREPG